MELFLIGWRNIFRNKRRSILNIIAVAMGVLIIIGTLGWVRGYFLKLYDSMIDFETGHIQILNSDYISQSRKHPLNLTVDNYETLRETILRNDRVKEVTGRIDFFTKLSKGPKSVMIMGRAIDPLREKNVTVISDNIIEGNYLDSAPGVLIGAGLAKKMGVTAGDTVLITAQDRHNNSNLIDLKIVGIFSFNYPAIDDNILYIDLVSAQEMLDLPNRVTRMVVKLHKSEDIDRVMTDFNNNLSLEQETIYPWQEFAQMLVQAVEADIGVFYVIMGILYIMILLGILNSMSMSVHERTREIGTLRAIGIRKSKLGRLFIFEGISLGLIASVIAIAAAIPFMLYIEYVGFDVSEYIPKDSPIPFGDRFTGIYYWYDYLLGAAFGIITTILGSFIPARRAANLNIANTMAAVNK